MDQPNHDDLHKPREWADRLDEIAEHVAHAYGEYGIHGELKHAAEYIRDLVRDCDGYKKAGAKLVKQVLAGVGVEALEQ